MSTVAWFRFEGVLVQRSALSCAAWMAARHHDLLGRFGRVGAGWLGRAASWAGDPEEGLRLGFRGLSGASEDRVVVLAEDYVARVVPDALNPTGLRLLQSAVDRGLTPVLLATHPAPVVEAVARQLGVEHWRANHLEMEAGRATGRLRAPVLTGRADRARLADDARALGLDPTHACAYGHGPDDVPLLASAPRPCVVTPPPHVRRLAGELGWPVVEARP